MKFTRFYLHPNHESFTNTLLCVSNLPLMLGPDAYTSFLKEHIQHGKSILLFLSVLFRIF